VNFGSAEEAQDWHDNQNDVVLRMRGNYTTSLSAWQEMRNKIQMQHRGEWNGVQGAEFRLYASDRGCAYIYVVFP
jgi:hypothetical protein